jgi:signal transduction histidine kinase
VIFDEGEPGDDCYLVESGIVRISKGGELAAHETLGFVHPGEFFGELALFSSTGRHARATAATRSKMARLCRANFEALRRRAGLELATAVANAGVRHLRDVDSTLIKHVRDSDRYREMGSGLFDIAHHLRAPLAGVILAADFLLQARKEGWLGEEELTKRLQGILSTAAAGLEYADALLAQLRGELHRSAGKLSGNQILERIAAEVQGLLSGKEVDFRLELSSETQISCFAEEIAAALLNLIRNAIEALPESGGILDVVARDLDQEIEFEVTDNGCGIPAHIQHRIFERRFTHGKAGGTGLGLDHVRRVAEQNGGQVTFVSSEGAGTSFRLRLPVDREGSL